MIGYIILLLVAWFLHRHNLLYAIQNTIAIKRRKLTNLTTLVRTQYKNIFAIVWICLCIITKNFYISILQQLNNNLVHVDKNTYELHYVIKGIRYTMRIKCRNGPRAILQAVDKNDEDITEIVQAYAGPMEDFHGVAFSPNYFGTSEITLSLSSGEDVVFTENQTITI